MSDDAYSGLLMSEALDDRLNEDVLLNGPPKSSDPQPRIRVMTTAVVKTRQTDLVRESTICEGDLASITRQKGEPTEVTIRVDAEGCRALLVGFKELALQVNLLKDEELTWTSLGTFRKEITLSSVTTDGALLTVTK